MSKDFNIEQTIQKLASSMLDLEIDKLSLAEITKKLKSLAKKSSDDKVAEVSETKELKELKKKEETTAKEIKTKTATVEKITDFIKEHYGDNYKAIINTAQTKVQAFLASKEFNKVSDIIDAAKNFLTKNNTGEKGADADASSFNDKTSEILKSVKDTISNLTEDRKSVV